MTELSNFNIINIALPSWLFPLSVIAVNLFGAAWLAVMTRISKKEEQNNDNQVKKNNSFYVFAFIVMALIAVIYTVKLFNILIG
jgi:cytochrome bd-type quinol oxidase subunit 2